MASTSSPYWGELPVPKASADRRPSVDASRPEPDQRHSLDAPAQLQPKANRVSVQTTNTESTLSPFASPITTSFSEQGLAPRPPSFPYGANRYSQQHRHPSQDTTDRDRRRTSRSGDSDTGAEYAVEYINDYDAEYATEYDAGRRQEPVADADDPDHLPAAPDVPRGPPLSYRPPYAATLNYSYPQIPPNNPPSPRKPDLSLDIDSMEPASPEQYYTTTANRPVAAEAAPSSGAHGGPSRRMSTRSGHSERRKKFEEVRSPLQKLELTLDSITKEEKRARVAAAEQVFLEREGQGAARNARNQHEAQPRPLPRPLPQPQAREQPRPLPQPQPREQPRQYPEQQVRFREHSAAASDGEPRPLLQPDASPVEESYSPIAPAQRGPTSQTSLEPPESPPASEKSAVRNRRPEPRNTASSSGAASGIPQRNLSFRERAAQNEGRLPQTGDHYEPLTSLPDDMVPKRTSSQHANLTKDPPGDPWSAKRKAAEKRYQAMQEMNATDAGGAAAGNYGHYIDSRPPQQLDSQWQLDEQPHGQPALAARQRQLALSDISDVDFSRPCMGGTVSVATTVAAAPVKKTARFEDDVEQGHGERHFDGPHHHRISNMLYHSRGEMQPGQGTYSHPTFLEEWKKGTIGTLYSPLLDLTTEENSSAEQDRTWWEQGGKRRESNPRIRKGEAFDGEYDEANGKLVVDFSILHRRGCC